MRIGAILGVSVALAQGGPSDEIRPPISNGADLVEETYPNQGFGSSHQGWSGTGAPFPMPKFLAEIQTPKDVLNLVTEPPLSWLLIGGSVIGGVALACQFVRSQTLRRMFAMNPPGTFYSVVAAKYFKALEEKSFDSAERAAFAMQEQARERARRATAVNIPFLSNAVTVLLADMDKALGNTYFKPSLRAEDLMERSLTLAILVNGGVLNAPDKARVATTLVSFANAIAALSEAQRARATLPTLTPDPAADQPSRLQSLALAEALSEFSREMRGVAEKFFASKIALPT